METLFKKSCVCPADWLTDHIWLMPSDKPNSEMAKATGHSHWSLSLHPEICLFAKCSRSSACIMVLPNLHLFSFVLHSFLHYRIRGSATLWFHGRLSNCSGYRSVSDFILCLKHSVNVTHHWKQSIMACSPSTGPWLIDRIVIHRHDPSIHIYIVARRSTSHALHTLLCL